MTEKYLIFKKRVILFIGFAFCIIAIYLFTVRMTVFEISSSDFKQDYFAARHLINHESIYSDTVAVNNHPPITAFLVAPLALLPYQDAGIVWSILSACTYFATGWLIFRELKINLALEYLILLIGFGFCWYPFQGNIGLGQWSIIIGFCIAVSWICLKRNKEYLAGLLLGLACLIKLYPGLLLLYLLFTKRWKALLTTISVVVLGTVILGLILGPKEIIHYFLTVVPRNTSEYNTFPQNFSILGILGKYFANGNWIKPIFISPIPINLLALILDLGVLILLVRTMLRLPSDKDSNDIKYAVIIIAMFFISPVTWQHNLTILILPICLLLKKILDQSFKIKSGYLIPLLMLILFSLPDIQIGRLLMSLSYPDRLPWYLGLGFLYYDIGLVILWWLLLRLRKAE